MIEDVLLFLDKNKIEYKLYRHEKAVSVEDSKRIIHIPDCLGCKSLFVKDKKSDRYFLLVLPNDKRAEMRNLAHYVGSEKFEFATEEKLMEYLGVVRGSVSPYCLLNPNSDKVNLLVDKQLVSSPFVRFHPCDNTASVVTTNKDFFNCMEIIGKSIIFVD